LWAVDDGKDLGYCVPADVDVRRFAVSRDGKSFALGDADRSLQLWSMRHRDRIGSPLLHRRELNAVAVSPDGKYALSAAGNAVSLWRAPRPETVLDIREGDWIKAVAFSPDAQFILTAGGALGLRGEGRLWNAATGEPIGPPMVHKDIATIAEFSPDGKMAATAGVDGLVRIADGRTGEPGAALQHNGGVFAISFSPAGDLVVTGSHGPKARIWDPASGKLAGEVLADNTSVMTVGFSPVGDAFFTGGFNDGLRLFRTSNHESLGHSPEAEPIFIAAFNRDGSLIAVASGRRARIFDVIAQRYLEAEWIHPDKIRTIAFSPDGRSILVAGEDGAAQILSNDLSRKIHRFQHGQPVKAAIFVPGGRFVLTGSDDFTAKLWDLEVGRSVGPALRLKGAVSGVATTRDGSRYAAVGRGPVRIWETPKSWEGDRAEVQAQVESRTGMELDEDYEVRFLDAAAWTKRLER
jgi:WD40 repeat protein